VRYFGVVERPPFTVFDVRRFGQSGDVCGLQAVIIAALQDLTEAVPSRPARVRCEPLRFEFGEEPVHVLGLKLRERNVPRVGARRDGVSGVGVFG